MAGENRGMSSIPGSTVLSSVLSPSEVLEFAQSLQSARVEGREMDRLTTRRPDLTLEDAYRIHDQVVKLRLEQGEKIIGYKMGLTSEAKRQQMGLGSPIYGTLLSSMNVQGGKFPLRGSIHPKIEPEIAFLTRKEMRGTISLEQAMDGCSAVFPAMEILDSRYIGFKYFSLNDVVADNSSASHFVLSPERRAPHEVDVSNVRMDFLVNGVVAHTAPTSDISGNPWNSLIQLCELLNMRGLSLPSGSIVLAGAATAAVSLEVGQVIELRVQEFEPFSVSI